MDQDAHYIENKTALKGLAEKIELITNNINEKIGEMDHNMTSNFNRLDKKIDSVSSEVKGLRGELPTIIDKRIQENTSNKVYNIFKWIVTSILGTAGVTIIVKLLTSGI